MPRAFLHTRKGRVEIQVYPASQLGSSKDQIEAVALGTQQIPPTQVITGGVVSTMLMISVQNAVFEQQSVADQTSVMVSKH